MDIRLFKLNLEFLGNYAKSNYFKYVSDCFLRLNMMLHMQNVLSFNSLFKFTMDQILYERVKYCGLTQKTCSSNNKSPRIYCVRCSRIRILL